MRAWLWLGLVVCAGCGDESGFGGQDLGERDPDNTSPLASDGKGNSAPSWEDTEASTTLVGAVELCIPGAEDDLSELELLGGSGAIGVLHRAVPGPCDARWTYDVTLAPGAIDVAYTVANSPDPTCECGWTFHYTLGGLAAGDWIVRADGDEATVDVL